MQPVSVCFICLIIMYLEGITTLALGRRAPPKSERKTLRSLARVAHASWHQTKLGDVSDWNVR